MEDNILKDFETFDENPNKFLNIRENSDYYLLYKDNQKYIVKRKIESISTFDDSNKVLIVKGYYDVITGQLLLMQKNIKGCNEIEKINSDKNYKLISMTEIFNLKGVESILLGIEQVNSIVDKDKKVLTRK